MVFSTRSESNENKIYIRLVYLFGETLSILDS